jgi:spermidine/putrescine transport system ATP-binding protein
VAVGGNHALPVALAPGAVQGRDVHLAIRPESLQLTARSAGTTLGVPGVVAEITFLGNLADCHVTLEDGTRLRVQLDPTQSFEPGQRVSVHFNGQASVFDA